MPLIRQSIGNGRTQEAGSTGNKKIHLYLLDRFCGQRIGIIAYGRSGKNVYRRRGIMRSCKLFVKF